ncbi:hypothetical protein WJX84_005551 [Apatococcus fuscideae]|uniref:Uncharacterized protein n=1 Tax=Apatococcus fuscideae TaxID=2026836 RepID=A0AAW1T714_9CHLO
MLPPRPSNGSSSLKLEASFQLRGVNYFGFDDANTMFDGLWGGSDSLAQDWATVVYRIQLLGFNAIRIPFSFKDLQSSPKSFSQSCTQGKCNTYLPVAQAKTMVDILNEPDFGNLRWEAANGLPGVGDLYLQAMDALYNVNSGLLYFIEGAGQQGSIAKNWGDGFTTDSSVVSSTGVSDPNSFFSSLLGKPYLNQVVIAPHVYGPSVSMDNSGSSVGSKFWSRLTTSFGYLNKAGYKGHMFAIALGETGTDFSQYPGDTQTLLDLASYVSLANGADDGKHNAITSVFWWAWNANSGQGMGIVGQDWTTIDWTKIAFLQGSIMNLKPWYQGSQPAPQGPQASSSVSLTPPAATIYPTFMVQPLAVLPDQIPGICNNYLPSDSVMSRFIYVVDFFAQNGFYVVLSNNLDTDKTALRSPNAWVQSWASIFSAVTTNSPYSQANVIVEPFSDPPAAGLQWNAADSLPGLSDLYIAVQDAISSLSPTTLFMLQGTGSYQAASAGIQGFATDATTLAQYGLSNPTTFFRELSGRPYVNRTILAPRINPPSITRIAANTTGETLWTRLDTSFGYLSQQGFCYNGVCRIFPIAVAEFGSNLTSAADINMMSDLSSYLSNYGSADTGNHAIIGSWFWATWPPNRPVVGGLLADNPYNIQWAKINYLAQLGLTPWYTPPSAHRLTPRIQNVTNPSASASSTTCGAELSAGGTITGVGSDSTDILWPFSSNQVIVNLVVTGSSLSFEPNYVAINGVNCSITGSRTAPPAPSAVPTRSLPLINRIPTSSLRSSPPSSPAVSRVTPAGTVSPAPVAPNAPRMNAGITQHPSKAQGRSPAVTPSPAVMVQGSPAVPDMPTQEAAITDPRIPLPLAVPLATTTPSVPASSG